MEAFQYGQRRWLVPNGNGEKPGGPSSEGSRAKLVRATVGPIKEFDFKERRSKEDENIDMDTDIAVSPTSVGETAVSEARRAANQPIRQDIDDRNNRASPSGLGVQVA